MRAEQSAGGVIGREIGIHMKKWFKKYSHVWILSYGILYFVWFCLLESANDRDFTFIHSTLDDLIPFCPVFIIPYLLWFLYVASIIVFTFFTSREDYYKTCGYLFSGMTVSLMIFTIFPNAFNRGILPEDQSVFSSMVSILRNVDTPTDVFPSIHVYNSIAVHIALLKNTYLAEQVRQKPQEKRALRIVKALSFLLMTAIILSTVFLKQHSIIDVFGGIILAVLLYPCVYVLPNRKKRSLN